LGGCLDKSSQQYGEPILNNMEVLVEFFKFLKQRKRYWLWPLCIVLVLLATFLVIAQGSALAPFIYSLF
jgi:hypothetical protein